MSDADGFAVDLDALSEASAGLGRLFQEMDRHAVRDVDCPADAFGHAELARITADFCDRWQRGVKNLLIDGDAIRAGLAAAVTDYSDMDSTAANTFNQLAKGGE